MLPCMRRAVCAVLKSRSCVSSLDLDLLFRSACSQNTWNSTQPPTSNLFLSFQTSRPHGAQNPSSASHKSGFRKDDVKKPIHFRLQQVIKNKRITLTVSGKSENDYQLKSEVEGTNKQLRSEASSSGQSLIKWWFRYFGRIVSSTFLPAGYPISVAPNYLSFAAWQSLTNICVTANSVLASTFLLYAVGLGVGAIPVAGALSWILKDGLGQLGTLLFGKAIAHNFDIHTKAWYVISCAKLKLASGLELITLIIPEYFLILGTAANAIKGLAWMAGSSTRSVFMLTFVRDNNIADITAKGTSQYICASLIGTAAGISMSAAVGQSFSSALACYLCISAITMYSAYWGVKSVPLSTLNSTRLLLISDRFLKSITQCKIKNVRQSTPSSYEDAAAEAYDKELRKAHSTASTSKVSGVMRFYDAISSLEDHDARDIGDRFHIEDATVQENTIPSPVELALEEPPLPWVTRDARIVYPSVAVGSSLEDIVEGNPALLVVLMSTFQYIKFMVLPTPNRIHIVLHADADGKDIIQAFLQAVILRLRVCDGWQPCPSSNLADLRITLHETLLESQTVLEPFIEALRGAGWLMEKVVVEADRRRAVW